MTDCPSCGASVDREDDECASCGGPIKGSTESFSVVGVPEPASAEEVDGPVLVVTKGPEVGERFYVEADEMTLGRGPECDVFLNDVTVSRAHARILRRGDEVLIEDAGSLNGTYVNGVRVDSAPLRTGDVIQVGTFQMVFHPGARR